MPEIKFKRGLKSKLPTLDVAEPAFTTDTEELFVGSADGNIQIAKQSDLDETNANVATKANQTSLDTTNANVTNNTNTLNNLANVNANAEVMSARGTYPLLGNRLDNTDTLLADIAYFITTFPRQSGETDDRGRLDRAIAAIPEGAELRFPIGTYHLNGAYTITKKIKIKGQARPKYDSTNSTLSGGTIFDNKFSLNVEGAEFENFGILSAVDNGFDIAGLASHTRIKNCITKVTSHGFLMQDIGTPVDDILIEDCETHDSTHGFVSKSKGVTFNKCRAYNHSTNGYAFISDNIEGATTKHYCLDNVVQNSSSDNCQFGLNVYCRDWFSDTNANNLFVKDLHINGFISRNCQYGYAFGDTNLTPDVGVSYNVVSNIFGVNLKEENSSVEAVIITRMTNSSLLNISLNTKAITWRTTTWNSNVTVTYATSLDNVNGNNFISTIGSSAIPTLLSMYSYFKTGNTAAKTITNFTGGTSDRVIFLMIDDDFTTIAPNANLSLYRTYAGKGSWIILKYKDGVWYDIAGWTPEKTVSTQTSITSMNKTIDESTNMWDVIFYQNTPYTIGFASPTVQKQRDISVTIRNTGSGDMSYGGFTTTNVIIPTGIPTTLTFGRTLVMKFIWVPQISKYACTSWQYI